MDSDFWTYPLAADKHQCNLHHHHQSSCLDSLSIDDFEVENEVRPAFPCPYCYEDFDIASLCSHLEDEHSCEPKVTICPVCFVKVASDMLSHIILQHGHFFKAVSLLGQDLRETHLQVLLGGGAYRSSNANVCNAATDSFLSSLIFNFPVSEAKELTKSVVNSAEDIAAKNAAPTHLWKSSFDPCLSYEEREKRVQQATGRAGFV